MKTISVIIERASDGTYSVYCEKEIFSGIGPTIEDAKADMFCPASLSHDLNAIFV